MSWWIGLNRKDFYAFIKTYNFKKAKYKPPTFESFELLHSYKKEPKTPYGKQQRLYRITSIATAIPRTNLPKDREKDTELVPIPYYEWHE